MKGKQRREEPMFACVRLEELIPSGHILRKIDRWIDFSIIHEKTADLYSSTGRPSIDPEVLIRMMVVRYLYGITSERRLCREVQLNLGYRFGHSCRFPLISPRMGAYSTKSKDLRSPM